jgi:hypothetical protein
MILMCSDEGSIDVAELRDDKDGRPLLAKASGKIAVGDSVIAINHKVLSRCVIARVCVGAVIGTPLNGGSQSFCALVALLALAPSFIYLTSPPSPPHPSHLRYGTPSLENVAAEFKAASRPVTVLFKRNGR